MADISEGSRNLTSIISGLVYEIRPWQWYKQSILLLGLIFSRNLFDLLAWAQVIVAIGAFSAVAGAMYIFNDIRDVEEDRKHPEKQNRPIASGQVSIPTAGAFALVLFAGGLYAAYRVAPLLLAVLLAYTVQNVLYTLYLKHVVIVDVMLVAIGFVLRAIAGVVAIDVALSPWLVICTFLAALLLALGKRRAELDRVENPGETRSILAEYTEQTLNNLLVVVLAALVMSYSLYTFFRAGDTMMLTLPFAYFAVFRYHHLVMTSQIQGRPEYLALDRPFVLNLGLWTIVAVAVLYDVPTRIFEVIG